MIKVSQSNTFFSVGKTFFHERKISESKESFSVVGEVSQCDKSISEIKVSQQERICYKR